MRLWRATLPMLLALLPAGCGPSKTDQPVAAQPAADLPQALPPVMATPARSAVDTLAMAAASYAAGEKPLALQDEGTGDRPAPYFDVIDCNDETRSVDPDGAASRAEIVARRVALLRRSLLLVGYSQAVIDEPLGRYAAETSRDADANREQEDYAALAAALEAKRAQLQPDHPPIRAEGGAARRRHRSSSGRGH